MKRSVVKNMLYLLRVLWQMDKKTFFMMIFHILCGTLLPLIGVLISSIVIGLLIQKVALSTFILILSGVMALYGVLQGLFSYLNEYNNFGFIYTRGAFFMKQIYLGRAHVDYAMLEDDVCNGILEDAIQSTWSNNDGLEGMYHRFIEFMIACLGLVLYACTSSGLNIFLTLGLFLLVIIQYLCFIRARAYEEKHRDELHRYLKQEHYLNQIAYDTSAGKDIRLYQLQDWIDDKFKMINRCITNIRSKDYRAYMIVDSITILLDFLRDLACYGYLIYRLTQGLPIDQFVFYLGIITGISTWFKKAGEAFSLLSKDNVLVNRMLTALQLKNKMHHGDGKKIMDQDITITFDHVYFQYPNQTQWILEDLNFTIQANEKVALVGSNGAGKSTIVKLILGFYVPVKGSVYVNGIDTRDIDVEDLYKHVTGIFQDTTKLSYTIAENVSMQDISCTDLKKVQFCLQQVGLWEDIKILPQKECTYLFQDVDINGIQLSGGQLQKLFMARVLYRDAKCLLLDEPTAALDALSEKMMYEQYHELTKHKTSLFISHRLSSTRFCDRIIVLDQGTIVEEGDHENLKKKNGIYAAMFEAQSKYYREGEKNDEYMERA